MKKPMANVEAFIKDGSLLEAIADSRNRLIMVMGGSDTGKTTLVESVVNLLSKEGTVGIVDLDMGQSHIGPPTTIAWGKTAQGFQDWEEVGAEEFYFTGSLTPMGNLLPSVAGAKLMTEKALSSCGKVVVDTTGLIAEPAGRVLKQHKIDALSPDIVLALEHSGELGPVLDAFRFHEHPKVHRLQVPDQVTAKSWATRNRYRLGKMERYFRHASIREVSLEEVGVRVTRGPSGLGHMELESRIISFRDKNNKDVALGIIRGIQLKDNLLSVLTPLGSERKISAIMIGNIEIDMMNSVLKERP
jgi:polynucleotide 5'-hydroxyl-kinase GRC3/NOL9